MKTTIIAIAVMLAATGCSSTMDKVTVVTPITIAKLQGAPASVAGKKLVIGDQTYYFRNGNSTIVSKDIDIGYGNSVTYKKLSDSKATVTVEEWESCSTYTLSFDTEDLGTASMIGFGEGSDWKKDGLKFRLIPIGS